MKVSSVWILPVSCSLEVSVALDHAISCVVPDRSMPLRNTNMFFKKRRIRSRERESECVSESACMLEGPLVNAEADNLIKTRESTYHLVTGGLMPWFRDTSTFAKVSGS